MTGMHARLRLNPLLVFLVLQAATGWAQASAELARVPGFTSIPKPRQARFLERFATALVLQQEASWTPRFDLLPGHIRVGLSRQEWARLMQGGDGAPSPHRPQAFVAESVRPSGLYPHSFDIFGCATEVDAAGRKLRAQAYTLATWENEDWYFDRIALLLQLEARTQPCSPQVRPSHPRRRTITQPR